MFKFDVIATIILFLAFFVEFGLILAHKPEKKLIRDMRANFLIGACLIFVGLFVKGVEYGLFSVLYSVAVFKPGLSWWLWIAGFL
ncbi:MAG: hypothetical protein ACJ749_12935, partial [Flavisolibacter sp.]